MIKINLEINSHEITMKPTRDGYGEGLMAAAEANQNVVAIGADITASTRVDWFKSKFPDRFISVGIAEQNQCALVINNHTIKPIDFETIIEAAQKTGAVVTAEEHQLMGGMGSAVLEVLAQKFPVPV